MKGRQLKQRLINHSKRQSNYYGYPQLQQHGHSKTLSIDTLTIPTRTITQTNQLRDDNKRDLTCHKRIGMYRQVVTSNNCGTLLPFLSSLRVREKRSHTQSSAEPAHQFTVLDRKPCMKRQKQSVCDFRLPNRCAQFYELWQHRANLGVKQTIDFEVSLRGYKGSNSHRKQFKYLNTRLKEEYPSPMFDYSQVKCPKLASLAKTIELKHQQ